MAEKPLLDSNPAPKQLQQNWTGLKQGQRPRMDTRRAYGSVWSPQPSPCTAATCVHPLSAPQLRSLTPRKETTLPRLYPLECETWALITFWRQKAHRFYDKRGEALASSAATSTSGVVLVHPSPQNSPTFDERGQQEVIFGLTAHGEQLNLVAVGLAAQQLVIKLVHDWHLHSMRDGAEGLPCTSCRPKRFLIEGFGTTHTGAKYCRVRVHPKPVEQWDIECEERRKGYKWQCEVTSVDVVVVAIGLAKSLREWQTRPSLRRCSCVAAQVSEPPSPPSPPHHHHHHPTPPLSLSPPIHPSIHPPTPPPPQRVAESRPLSSSHSSQVLWKPTFCFNDGSGGTKDDKTSPSDDAKERTAQTDGEGTVNRHSTLKRT